MWQSNKNCPENLSRSSSILRYEEWLSEHGGGGGGGRVGSTRSSQLLGTLTTE